MTSRDQIILGRALRELRLRTGVTQEQMAARAGTSSTYVSRLESGQRDIRWTTIRRLLAALDVSLSDLAVMIEEQDDTPKH